MYSVLKVLSAFVLAAVPLIASAQESCSQESWLISGSKVNVVVCAERASSGAVVTVAVSGPGGQFNDRKAVRMVPSVGPARVLENVNLGEVGLHGTLHLSLAYDGSRATIESALLTPGAIQLK